LSPETTPVHCFSRRSFLFFPHFGFPPSNVCAQTHSVFFWCFRFFFLNRTCPPPFVSSGDHQKSLFSVWSHLALFPPPTYNFIFVRLGVGPKKKKKTPPCSRFFCSITFFFTNTLRHSFFFSPRCIKAVFLFGLVYPLCFFDFYILARHMRFFSMFLVFFFFCGTDGPFPGFLCVCCFFFSLQMVSTPVNCRPPRGRFCSLPLKVF